MRTPFLICLGVCLWSLGAEAALPVGHPAPLFDAKATLGGNEFSFSLADALRHGPVVLYFYPAAFTPGCTVEAHEFAAAMPQFQSLHATVIGVSEDGIKKLDRFSVTECRKEFPVASDASGAISKSYDAVLSGMLGLASRTSYVIAPNDTVIYSYSAMDPNSHVANTMHAVEAWDAANK